MELIGTTLMNGIFWIAYGIIIIVLLIIWAPFWLILKIWDLLFGLEPTESNIVVPDNCFLWNEELWAGVPNRVDPVFTVCGLE